MSRHLLRADLHRLQVKLDEAQERETYADPYGAVWQHSRGYWYRAFDSDNPVSSFELAQITRDTDHA